MGRGLRCETGSGCSQYLRGAEGGQGGGGEGVAATMCEVGGEEAGNGSHGAGGEGGDPAII